MVCEMAGSERSLRGAYCIASKDNPDEGGGWNNQQLMKGIGLTMWLLAKNHGFRSVMVGNKCSENYPYLSQMPELELEFLPKKRLMERLIYIDANAAGIDLLVCYGAYPHYVPIVEFYKQVRPDGKVYLASDMNTRWAKKIPHEHPLYKKFLERCDLISVTNTTVQKYLQKNWQVPAELIRNGFYNFTGKSFDDVQKENIILTVGRIGTRQKQNQILLEAFAAVADKLPDWTLRLVGEISEEFKSYIQAYFLSQPKLRGRVIFTGLIEDKAKLLEEYKRAKIFCLTSKFEGTPNAATEALISGCYVITSEIDAANDIIDKGRCGKVFPIGDSARLSKLLKEICRDEKLLLKGGQHAAAYARAEFDAEKITAKLYEKLYGG